MPMLWCKRCYIILHEIRKTRIISKEPQIGSPIDAKCIGINRGNPITDILVKGCDSHLNISRCGIGRADGEKIPGGFFEKITLAGKKDYHRCKRQQQPTAASILIMLIFHFLKLW